MKDIVFYGERNGNETISFYASVHAIRHSLQKAASIREECKDWRDQPLSPQEKSYSKALLNRSFSISR
jgi:hypothetical protein